MKDLLKADCTVNAIGEIRWPDGGMYNNVNIWDSRIKYDHGLELRFLSQDLAKPVVMEFLSEYRQNGTMFFGTKGWLGLSRTYAESNIPDIHQDLNSYPKESFGLHGDRGTHLLEFARLIKGESESYMDIDDATLSDTISHLTNVAVRQGGEIKWDAGARKLVNNPEGDRLMNREHRAAFAV